VENPVWGPGTPARLFAVREEWVALQVVVEAGEAPLEAVTVTLEPPTSTDGACVAHVDRFVEHFLAVRRASGGRTRHESLGWEDGAGPPSGAWVGPVPDALIPVERAPWWSPYPMRVEPRTNGIVWIDLFVPRGQAAGTYRSAIAVLVSGRPLASIPVELEVADATLPDPTSNAMVFYDPSELERRIGLGAERALCQLLHAHRIAPLHDATSPADVARQRDALDGSLYTGDSGYVGPGAGQGDGVLAVGAYGSLGDPDAAKLARVEAVADAVEDAKLLGQTGLFVYADDERCRSARGAAWRRLLNGATSGSARRVRVAWTCSDDPAEQPVDVAMLLARYDTGRARRARERGKEAWVYNGVLPRTGTFLLDADAVSPRANGWLSALYAVPRWFYWESTYWYGRHGTAPIDPFVEPESMHNDEGDWANGDGVLVYPGRQEDVFREHSLGLDGVVPSIRLKNWRRGLQDAGYFELARRKDAAGAESVARSLLPAAFDEVAGSGRPATWSPRGAPFFEARRALLAIALGMPVPLGAPRAGATAPAGAHRIGRRAYAAGGGLVAVLAAAYALSRIRPSARRR
jgi:hypothetical protein